MLHQDIMQVFIIDGILFFRCCFILGKSSIPCLPENVRINCIFVSLLSAVFYLWFVSEINVFLFEFIFDYYAINCLSFVFMTTVLR